MALHCVQGTKIEFSMNIEVKPTAPTYKLLVETMERTGEGARQAAIGTAGALGRTAVAQGTGTFDFHGTICSKTDVK